METLIASVNVLAILTLIITIVTPVSLYYLRKFHDKETQICGICHERIVERKKRVQKSDRIKERKRKQRTKRMQLRTAKTTKKLTALKANISERLE